MSFLQQYDILKLSDEKSYTVAEIVNENNTDFLMLVEMTDKEEMTENYQFAKVVVMPSRKYGVETIDDKEEIKKLSEIFLPMFQKDFE